MSRLFSLLAFYKYSAKSNMFCHDRCVKFKTNKYHGKSGEIRLGSGNRNRRELFMEVRLLYIFAHNSTSIWVYNIFRKIGRNLQTSGKDTKFYMLTNAIAVSRGRTE